ncbi:MAG: hypothetical protein QW667_04030 [Candidatus Bathyarchaeia archaeon]
MPKYKFVNMNTLVDDIGSFPLPNFVSKKSFEKAYALARQAIIDGEDIKENDFLLKNFYQVVIDSFKKKIKAGLDIINYPQHYDIHAQFLDAIHKAMAGGTYLVGEKEAIIPEVYVISQEGKSLSEDLGKRIMLRVCVTGPMELYLKEVGTVVYKDVLLMFAETVRRFAKNAILSTKHLKTEVVSIDEPSLGFQNINIDRNTLMEVMEKTFDFKGVIRQIHLHSTSNVSDLLAVKNIDVLSFEYAASPKNIEAISRKMLEEANKQIRVGISRTDINSIIAELYETGVTKPEAWQLVEDEETIRKRFLTAKKKYGDAMTFTGPDCGLGGWPTQEAAQLLLKRTVNAVKSIKMDNSQSL